MTERPMTRAEAISLSDEKRLVEQGFEFLDEKRVILASEIISRLSDWEEFASRRDEAVLEARSALAREVRRYGFEALQFRAAEPFAEGPEVRPVRFLGARLIAASGREPAAARGEEGSVARAFGELHEVLAEMALLSANLFRLADEYRRTERRAKALENVLIPEIVADLKRIEAQLEANELEDAVRVRIAAGSDQRRSGASR